jgi:hypothetical protein
MKKGAWAEANSPPMMAAVGWRRLWFLSPSVF